MLTNFYIAFAPLSFTLLGLWLIVVQTRHAEWRGSAPHRRRAYAVFLHFALPGLMSLLSLIDPNSKLLWRVAFAVVALAGCAALLVFGKEGWIKLGRSVALEISYWISVVLYLLIALFALFPTLLDDVGISLKPLRLEAILLCSVVFLGVNVAWLLMFDESPVRDDTR
jgi:hypothetical protein